jgi:hypothetical protein
MDTPLHVILLIVAVLALLKATWMLIWPAGFRATVDWWTKMPVPAARLLGATAILAGLALVGLAIAEMGDPVIAIATIVGAMFVLFGLLYQWPGALFPVIAKPFGQEGKNWVIRTCGAVSVVVVVLLIVYVHLHDKV